MLRCLAEEAFFASRLRSLSAAGSGPCAATSIVGPACWPPSKGLRRGPVHGHDFDRSRLGDEERRLKRTRVELVTTITSDTVAAAQRVIRPCLMVNLSKLAAIGWEILTMTYASQFN
jgi:hypothetical protein